MSGGASLRVLHVIDTSAVGGGQTAVRHLIEGFRATDVIAELACRPGGPLVDAASRAGATVHPVSFDKRYLPTKARAVARIVAGSGIRLIHSHGLLATYYCALARTLFGVRVPLVYQQHGFHHHNHGPLTRRPRRQAERLLCRHADRVIAASQSDFALLAAGGYGSPASLRLIHYGIPRPAAEASAVAAARTRVGAGPRRIVGLVARLHPQKGVETFLRAAALARREAPDVLFAVVGSGALETELRGMAANLGLEDDVRWLGSDLPGTAFMPVFDVGVLSSRWEGLPLVLLEYMATSRAIVSTRVAGCLDAVGDEEAELVPPDDPSAMAGAILALLRDPGRAARRAAAAHARYREAFTVEAMVARVRDLYRELAA